MLAKINRYFGGTMPLFLFDADDGAGSGGAAPTSAPGNEAPDPATGPGDGTPEADPTNAPTDGDSYQSRYENMRQEFDRRGTELDGMKQFQQAVSGAAGPEAQAQALRQLGIELEGDDASGTDDYVDPDERYDQLEARLNERDAADQQAQYEAAEQQYLADGIEILEGNAGREFTDEEIQTIAAIARNNPTDQGVPDLDFAWQQYEALTKGLKQSWVESKQTGRQPGSGVPAVEQVDLDNDGARVDFIAQRLSAARENAT